LDLEGVDPGVCNHGHISVTISGHVRGSTDACMGKRPYVPCVKWAVFEGRKGE
jgi:hypothetical protein